MVRDYISEVVLTPRRVSFPLNNERSFVLADCGLRALSVGAGDFAKFSPGFKGRIVSIIAIVETETTDANADATLSAEINGTNTTGGSVTLNDIGGANPVTTVGRIEQGSLITAANTFGPGDDINIEQAITNAFSDGIVRVLLVLEETT
jgi:hypothetical protein